MGTIKRVVVVCGVLTIFVWYVVTQKQRAYNGPGARTGAAVECSCGCECPRKKEN